MNGASQANGVAVDSAGDVYVTGSTTSDNFLVTSGAFQTWLANTTSTSGVFTGQNGHAYRLSSIAVDAVGNQEAAKTNAEATTTVSAPAGNAIDDATFFVSQRYRDFLNREPDVVGFNFWTNQIASCNGNHNALTSNVETSSPFISFRASFKRPASW